MSCFLTESENIILNRIGTVFEPKLKTAVSVITEAESKLRFSLFTVS